MGSILLAPSFFKGVNFLKRNRINLILGLLIILGISVLFYPFASRYINKKSGSYAISEFRELVSNTDQEKLNKYWQDAQAYNQAIRNGENGNNYDSILDFGNGMMGYISIPCIEIYLPIYHGVGEEVLCKGIGHMKDSSFPIGGEGNHSVLTGHTGLPSAELFSDLSKVKQGDMFYITILSETQKYKVDQIKVVLPDETQDLAPVAGKDYCTLVTCTPYGINSHRLLVRGGRVVEEPTADYLVVETKERQITTILILLCVCAVIIGTIIVIYSIYKKHKHKFWK